MIFPKDLQFVRQKKCVFCVCCFFAIYIYIYKIINQINSSEIPSAVIVFI